MSQCTASPLPIPLPLSLYPLSLSFFHSLLSLFLSLPLSATELSIVTQLKCVDACTQVGAIPATTTASLQPRCTCTSVYCACAPVVNLRFQLAYSSKRLQLLPVGSPVGQESADLHHMQRAFLQNCPSPNACSNTNVPDG